MSITTKVNKIVNFNFITIVLFCSLLFPSVYSYIFRHFHQSIAIYFDESIIQEYLLIFTEFRSQCIYKSIIWKNTIKKSKMTTFFFFFLLINQKYLSYENFFPFLICELIIVLNVEGLETKLINIVILWSNWIFHNYIYHTRLTIHGHTRLTIHGHIVF